MRFLSIFGDLRSKNLVQSYFMVFIDFGTLCNNYQAYLNHYPNPQLNVACCTLEFFSVKGGKNDEYKKFVDFTDRKCSDPDYKPSQAAMIYLDKISSNGIYLTNKNPIETKEMFITKIQDPKFNKGNSFEIDMSRI